MAKIFRKTYHEVSSSWDFRHLIKKIDDNQIIYEILRDQDNLYLLTFSLSTPNVSNSTIKINYNAQKDEILSHDADLKNDVRKTLFYKYIDYAYNHITYSMLQNSVITIFSKRICKLNEYVQTQYQNIYFQIEGFYEIDNDIIKVYIRNLNTESFNRLANYLTKVVEKESNISVLQNIRNIDDIFSFFTVDELIFIRALFLEKRSTGSKTVYISISKDAFVRLIPFIKNIQAKFSIFETGEKLVFAENPLSLNLGVTQVDSYNFRLSLSETHTIHQFFVYLSTYLLIENTIYKANLPFDDDTVLKILQNNFVFGRAELVYYKTIVGRQLFLFNNYLDFDDNIDFPDIAEDAPKVFFFINKLNDENSIFETQNNDYVSLKNIPPTPLAKEGIASSADKSDTESVPLNIHAYFEYNDGKKIPLTLAMKNKNLFKLSFIKSDRWYHLPDELMYSIQDFVTNHLFYNSDKINEYEWNITKPQEIVYIQNNLYDRANQNWNIVVSEDLNNDFVKTINLVPEIELSSDENIDWFSYKVTYKFQNIEITQDILRDFFFSDAKFLSVSDGSKVKIGNREIFDEIESMINLSHKDADYFHKMAIYRLPWIYELKKMNPAITIYGDKYLDEMYTALQKRALKENLQPNYLLKPVMRSYQRAGYEWLKMLEKFRLNGILADEMGLGKTLQAISILTDLPQNSKSLIICPKTLLFNWVAEIEKFNPNLKYFIYEGTKDVRINLLRTVPVQIVICSYNLIQNDLDEFSKINFEYLILDEAQHIKNHITMRAKAIKKIKARHKLAMTGTPLENSILELWSAFDFLMPGYLPTLNKMKEFISPATSNEIEKSESNPQTLVANKMKEQKMTMEKLKQYIAPFILRRKKKDVLIELPDKQEQAIFCTMTEEQEKHYIHVLEAVKNEVFGEKSELFSTHSSLKNNRNFNYITMLAALTRLRQICDHPGLINTEWLKDAEMSGKLNTLRELIESSAEDGRKILIFSQYIKMLKLIEGIVKNLNIPYEYMDGRTKDRKAIINHFNNNEKVRIFLISLKTGGFGINLTSADTVIIVDPWWNPMVENQAVDRVHRIGQTKKVLVYKMITKGSVEEKIMLLQKKKRDLFENVIDQGEIVLKNLDTDDLKLLFEYKDNG